MMLRAACYVLRAVRAVASQNETNQVAEDPEYIVSVLPCRVGLVGDESCDLLLSPGSPLALLMSHAHPWLSCAVAVIT